VSQINPTPLPRSTGRPPPPKGLNLTLDDVYHTLFRQKWKILLISSLGIIGALILPRIWHVPYQSEAKLLIRYVLETKTPGQVGAGEARSTVESGGDKVINTEIEILTSLDLAGQVADIIGPEKILAKAGGGSERSKAAAVIHKNLTAESAKDSSVIHITFRHPEADIVQPVLVQLIEGYRKKHFEIHRAVGLFDDFLAQETDQLRSRLVQTEDDLRKTKAAAGVLSLDDSKKVFTEQSAKIQQAIFEAEAELAERKAAAAELNRLLRPESAEFNAVDTNQLNSPVPPEKLAEYRKVLSALQSQQKREQELLLQFTPGSAMLKPIEDQVAESEKRKQTLEEENPGLLSVAVAEVKSAEAPGGAHLDSAAELAKVTALESKIKVLTNQLAEVRAKAAAIDTAEGSITELQRKKELEEAHYKYFSASLEQSRIDEALGAGHVSNISNVQYPSPPFQDTKKLQKARAMLLVGGIAAALGLAFLLEVFLDRSLKRPAEIESKVGVPLLISIPVLAINGNSKPRLINGKASRLLGIGEGSGTPNENDQTHPPVEHPDPSAPTRLVEHPGNGQLACFCEALRDRLITFFEIKNLTHKPKLVAVTSCGNGAGVTTIAAGLAASLSETGDGNVLLVDMNGHNAAAHHFFKGRLECGLDDAFDQGKRDTALVQDKLYVVSEGANEDKLPRILPKRFTNLVPRMKASDYDYIIFDMPPISQISVTPRLARFMDFVVMVVESEKSDREVVKRGLSLLADASSNVGFVLNKRRAYVPKSLQQEL
jgi:uncharacterized protein involved in exopolysaccharide biosynthesis/Mrp family chromosome partitioning ATPase